MIRRFFTPPVFDNDEDNFRGRFINGFAWVVIGIVLVAILISGFDFQFSTTDAFYLGLIAVQAISIYLLHKGKLNASGSIIIVLSWIGLTYQAYSADGVRDVVIIAYIAIALLASIIVNRAAGGIVIAVSIGAIWVLALLEANGTFEPRFQNPLDFARDFSLILLVITSLIYFSTTTLRDAIARANKSEDELRKSNKELQELNLSLEDRISSRTADLETANQRNEKRAKQFEAIAQVARATTSNESLETLLPRLASLWTLDLMLSSSTIPTSRTPAQKWHFP